MKKESGNLPDRRKAFKKMGKWLLAGGGTLTAAWFGLGREGPIDAWVAVVPLQDLPSGAIQMKFVTVTAHGSWVNQRVDRAIWIYRNPDDTVTVLSGVCPHKSYNINWRADLGTYVCPGHKSAFDLKGKVLSGPAPRPLDTLEHKIENGVLMVRYQKFKSNLPVKDVIT